jgi:hypothetical protein
LDENHFYKHPTTKDGFNSPCKECRGQKFGQREKKTGDGWRICPHCERKLPATKKYFSGNNQRKDGLHPICKECIGRVFKEPPLKGKDGYKICSKCGRELPATREYYYADNRAPHGCVTQCFECYGLGFGHKGFSVKDRNENGEKRCRKCKEWLPENKFYKMNFSLDGLYGQCKVCCRIENSQRDKGKMNLYSKRPEVIKRLRNAWHRRKSLEKELPHDFTVEQWEDCKEYFNNKCCYCGKEEKLEQDHFVALTKGGGYEISNLVPACGTCNRSKNASNFFRWFPTMPFYSELREKKILKYLGYIKEGLQQRILF